MNVTEVNISFVKPQDGLIGFASVIVGGQLFLGSIAIHQKLSGGFRLTYPTRKLGGNQLHVFHPIRRELGLTIEQAIFSKLKEVVNNHHAGYHHPTPEPA